MSGGTAAVAISAATSTAGGQDRIAEDDSLLTGWFRDAILKCPTPASGEWNDVLLRACHGQGEQDRDWVRQQIPPVPTHHRQLRRKEPRICVWEYLTGRGGSAWAWGVWWLVG
ncbi:hypothetical protein ACFVYE_43120 [Streptomyces sp. NPDC058239]|uniref:hypothetical protein n=1 Tax=Streptomyces sp. NPDC058239 TaxID=3346395 RepID=UPI0036E18B01